MIEKTNPRILLVDDERESAEIVATYLRNQGYQCLVETSGWKALSLLGDLCFDLAIVDLLMPDMSGIEFLKKLKASEPQVAVIMLSALTEVQTATQCLRLGALDYLIKPVDFSYMLNSIHRALEKRSLAFQQRDLQHFLQKEVAKKTEEIQLLFLSTIEALVSSIEAKDPYTEGHSRRVTLYSLLIAYELGLNSAQRESLRLTGLLHDIGKIGIPESVLNKPEKLDATEYAVIQKHSVIGESILKSIPQLKPVSISIRHHHERFDGKGYPDRLDRENIPLLSRIIMVADSYDSMTTDRSYRQAKGADHARDELDRCSGTQFDPAIVSAFLNIKMNCYDLQQLVKFSQDNQLWKMLFLRNEFE